MKRIKFDIIGNFEPMFDFMLTAGIAMLCCCLGYAAFDLGYSIEHAMLIAFVVYCLVAFLWWLSGKVSDAIFRYISLRLKPRPPSD